MRGVRVAHYDGNLIINDKYFLRRIAQFEDKRLDGTRLQGVNCLNFHFVTLHNQKKYSLNINYYGDDKGIDQFVGLFNTIGGSLKFN